MMLAATTAGIGFGNAGCHIPHACAYPIASLKHVWTPAGYPDPHPFVPHGFSVTVTAPAAFRFTENPHSRSAIARQRGCSAAKTISRPRSSRSCATSARR